MPARSTHNKDSTKHCITVKTTVENTLETIVDYSDRTRSTLQRTVGIPTTAVEKRNSRVEKLDLIVEKLDLIVETTVEKRDLIVEKREKILWDYFS
jgi:hypothetical protein